MIRRCLDDDLPFGVVLITRGREAGRSDLSLAGIGTMARIRQVSRNGDGTFDIVTVGTRRFRLLAVDAVREPYLVGEVAELEDALGDGGRVARLADEVGDRFVRYVELIGRTGEAASDEVGEPDAGDDDEEDEDDVEGQLGGFLSAEDDESAGGWEDEAEDDEDADDDEDDEVAAELTIPDDPTTLSYLLTGIIATDPARRQELLEAATTERRLGLLAALLARENLFLERRLLPFVADPNASAATRN